jgi:GTP cyclohydrolase I
MAARPPQVALIRPRSSIPSGRLLRYTERLSGKYSVRVLNLVAICFKNYRPPCCVTVILLRDPGKCVAGHHRVLGETMVRVKQGRAEGDRHGDLIQFRAISFWRVFEHLKCSLRGGRDPDRKRDVVVTPHARPARVDRNLGELSTVGIPHPGGNPPLEPGADAADPRRIIDDLEPGRPWGGSVIRSSHSCMTLRGARATGAEMVTSRLRRVFRDRPEARAEFLQLAGPHWTCRLRGK